MHTSKFILRDLFWESTINCNARCEFCGSRCGESFQKDLDSIYIKNTFHEIADAYDASAIMINVTGGEPLLRADLFDVMSYASLLGFHWGMVTNGSLITEEIVQKMKSAHMETIAISIDAISTAHEQIRKLPSGSFQDIIRGIQILHDAACLDCIEITTVVTRKNVDSLESMYEFFKTLPIDSWRIAFVDPIGRGKDVKELLLRNEDYKRVFAFLDQHQFSSQPILTISCCHYFGPVDSLYRSGGFVCDTGKSVGSILANGDIYVCPNVPRIPSLIQGNITKNSFVDVWENQYEWFRDENNKRSNQCLNCSEWDRCKGDSTHTWDFEHEKVNFCWMEKGEGICKDYALPEDIKAFYKAKWEKLRGIKISYGSSSNRVVYITPDAMREVSVYFHLGANHPTNQYELMAGLYGHRDERKMYVEGIIPVHLPFRSHNQAEFNEEIYRETLKEVEIINECRQDCSSFSPFKSDFLLLGYIHSHPDDHALSLSNQDIDLHGMLRKDLGDVLTGLANPIREEIKFYQDSIYTPVDVVVMNDED